MRLMVCIGNTLYLSVTNCNKIIAWEKNECIFIYCVDQFLIQYMKIHSFFSQAMTLLWYLNRTYILIYLTVQSHLRADEGDLCQKLINSVSEEK